jgi:putative cell wall-binding protein/GH25 family lysozyme M1 (1,4-beta-N-acetylmuramidase)
VFRSNRRLWSAVGVASIVASFVVTGTTVAQADVPPSPSLGQQDSSADHELGASTAEPSVARALAVSPPSGLPGFDVSSYQPNPDFAAAARAGARFTFVKASEGVPGTYTNGAPTGSTNRYRSAQFAGARAAGLTAGFYHYALPFYSSGAAQGQFFLDNSTAWQPGMLPPVLDMEVSTAPDRQGGRCWGLSNTQMVMWIQAWIGTVVARTGVQPIIYTNQDFWSTCTGNSTAFPKDRLFVAYYPSTTTDTPVTPPTSSFARWTFWQWSQTDGSPFPGNQDVFHGSAADLAALTRPSGTSVGRLAGADAYATAGTVAASAFTPSVTVDGSAGVRGSVPVVYVASRENYPDALSAGAAAGYRGGPVLLVTSTVVPDATKAALRELNPREIVVIGGTSAITDGVATQLGALVGGRPVTRVFGADRYATSAAVSASTFPTGRGGTAYVAAGTNFPDALSGGALAAGTDAGPMLLTSPTALPSATEAELARLRPAKIVVLGGDLSVSPAVADQLARIAPVQRLAGADRFATSARIAEVAFPQGASTVYLANGLAFPDALAGAPVAGRLGAPVLLTPSNALPTSIRDRLASLRPTGLIVLGGTVSISADVEKGL